MPNVFIYFIFMNMNKNIYEYIIYAEFLKAHISCNLAKHIGRSQNILQNIFLFVLDGVFHITQHELPRSVNYSVFAF